MTGSAERVEVAVQLPVAGTYSYAVPLALRGRSLLGHRVLVPFGARAVTGVVISEPSPPSGASPDALGDLWPVVPTTERVFHVTGEATAFVRLYQGTRPAPGPVSISIQVVDERGQPVRAHAETIDSVRFGSTRTAGVSFPLPLSALDPGAYALSIEARRDGQPPVTSRVAFAVRDR